jgi:hypothetical protein
MSTMSYGDIIPGNDLVRTAAYAQTVAGVMFLSVFIAGVVSLYGIHRNPTARRGEQTGPAELPWDWRNSLFQDLAKSSYR